MARPLILHASHLYALGPSSTSARVCAERASSTDLWGKVFNITAAVQGFGFRVGLTVPAPSSSSRSSTGSTVRELCP